MKQKLLEHKNNFIYGGGAALTTALVTAAPVLAADETADISTTLLSEFTSGVTQIKTLLLGIIGIVMTIIVLKVAFRAGVSFFKSAATK